VRPLVANTEVANVIVSNTTNIFFIALDSLGLNFVENYSTED